MLTPMPKPRIGLFVTCLMNVFRPNIGFAAVKLLDEAGYEIIIPPQQTCCAQPAINSGDRDSTQAVAQQVIATFEPFDYLVSPSGSCIATLRKDYPTLFDPASEWAARAQALAEKSYELLSFLSTFGTTPATPATYAEKVTYHDSCSGLRSLGIERQPRQLLTSVAGLELVEMQDAQVCCGFGGTFCVKYPEISSKMVDDKIRNIADSGASTVLGGDLGCLMNIAGRLRRQGLPIKVFHTAEVLANLANDNGIAGLPVDGRQPCR